MNSGSIGVGNTHAEIIGTSLIENNQLFAEPSPYNSIKDKLSDIDDEY